MDKDDDLSSNLIINSEGTMKDYTLLNVEMKVDSIENISTGANEENQRYSCDLCDYSNHTKRNLKNHILSHHEGVRFKCDSCDFQAKDKSNLKRHILTLHKGVRYSCDQCDYKATQLSSLRIHKESTHEGIKHTCEICGFMASRPSNLTAHIKWKHSDEIFYCDQCEFTTKLKCRLTSHYKKSHDLSFLSIEVNEEKDISSQNGTDVVHEQIKVNSQSNLENEMEEDEYYGADEDHLDNEDDSFDSEYSSEKLDNATPNSLKDEVSLKDEYKLSDDEYTDPKLEVEEDDTEKLIQCDQCDYKSPKGWNVRIHKQTVHDGIKFECKHEDCHFQTTRKYQLKKHLKSVHNEDVKFPCEFCESIFEHEYKLKIHMREEHDKGPKKSTSKKVKLVADPVPQISSKSDRKLRTCYFCEFTSYNPSEMKNHRESLHFGEQYKCKECDYAVGLQKNLYAHMRNKHGHEYKTKSKLKSKSNLKIEIEGTVGESVLCDQCEFQAENSKQLKIHIKTHQNTEELFCPECPYSTFKKKLLRGHIYIQHKSKDRFLCDECSFATNTNQAMKRHKESGHSHPRFPPHRPAEVIYCDQCEYNTTVNRNLKAHILVEHMGVRYPCDHCGFQARDKSSLKRHQLSTHEGVRYACDQCDYRATQTSSLKLHKESKHQGIKYQCDLCSFMASRQDNLRIHKKIKHEDEVFYCGHCTFRTKVHSRLNTHMKNVHNIINANN